ncbi:MAG TPA: hypothetical protein VGB13_01770 [Candidatus Krumholzibacteria bacterium]
MERWIEDQKFVAAGGSILYAVDADIVTLYLEPHGIEDESRGRRAGKPNPSARVFPDDGETLVTATALALGKHIFTRLPPPLLLIPPVEQQVRRMARAIVQKAADRDRKARRELAVIGAEIAELAAKDDDGVFLWFQQRAPGLTEVLVGRTGPAAALHRLGQLLERRTIAIASFALERNWIEDVEFSRALQVPFDGTEAAAVREAREDWFERLFAATHDPEARTRLSNVEDAQMLAHLECINQKLDARRRIVLITATTTLLRAARSYRSPGSEAGFADLYLRHPRSYLADPNVLAVKDASGGAGWETLADPVKIKSGLLDCLDTFLGKFDSDREGYQVELARLLELPDNQLEEMARAVLARFPRIADEFRESRTSYGDSVVLVGMRDGDLVDEQALARDLKAQLHRISDKLDECAGQTWDALFKGFTEAGYGLLFHRPHGASLRRARNIPPLFFESLPEAQRFVAQMLDSGARMTAQHYDHCLGALYAEDPSGYTYWLAYGLLFAAEQSWRVAAILAERALSIARTGQCKKTITGREAAYLRAVTLRHDARCATDLAQVEAALELAETCLKQDHAERPGLEAFRVRFEAERLALDVSYQLFAHFADETIPGTVRTLGSLQDSLHHLLESERLARLRERDVTVYRAIERSLLTCLGTVLVLRACKRREAIAPGPFAGLLNRFDDNLTARDARLEPSFLACAVHLAWRCWSESSRSAVQERRGQLAEHLNDADIRLHSIAPYDKKRFEFLREVVPAIDADRHRFWQPLLDRSELSLFVGAGTSRGRQAVGEWDRRAVLEIKAFLSAMGERTRGAERPIIQWVPSFYSKESQLGEHIANLRRELERTSSVVLATADVNDMTELALADLAGLPAFSGRPTRTKADFRGVVAFKRVQRDEAPNSLLDRFVFLEAEPQSSSDGAAEDAAAERRGFHDMRGPVARHTYESRYRPYRGTASSAASDEKSYDMHFAHVALLAPVDAPDSGVPWTLVVGGATGPATLGAVQMLTGAIQRQFTVFDPDYGQELDRGAPPLPLRQLLEQVAAESKSLRLYLDKYAPAAPPDSVLDDNSESITRALGEFRGRGGAQAIVKVFVTPGGDPGHDERRIIWWELCAALSNDDFRRGEPLRDIEIEAPRPGP